MILPIVAYGDPVLRQVCEDINQDYPNLEKLVENMFESMYNANGVGLAAPQVGLPIRLFIVDTEQLDKEEEELKSNGSESVEPKKVKGIRQVFINATMLSETGGEWNYEEGCLSIPGIREQVMRERRIEIEYLDENFEYRKQKFDGINARVIQHEYDHVEGILFTDKLKPLKKRLLKKKLLQISRGETKVGYKMRIPAMK